MKKKEALIVDDSAFIRNLLSKIFTDLEFNVNLAEDGKDALEKISQVKPDIITSDYEMPNMDGKEFCTKIRLNQNYKDIPIIVISTHTEDQEVIHLRSIGIKHFIHKPFNKEQIKQLTDEIFSNKES